MGLASHQRACKRQRDDELLDTAQAAERLQPTLGNFKLRDALLN